MKKRYLFLPLFLLFSLVACDRGTHSDEVEELKVAEGMPFDVSFGGFMSDLDFMSVRAAQSTKDLNDVDNLRLLVFDENGNFLYSRKAVLGSRQTAPGANDSYLPDQSKGGIEQVYTFTVKLLTSSKKRYIHFVANHDWEGFPQDYFLQGQSHGQIIPTLISDKTEFWRLIELNELNSQTLYGKVIKLLRNKAKISVVKGDDAQNFRLDGFAVYNAYDQGTVAPYIFHKDLSFSFPNQPEQPTVPAGVSTINLPFDAYQDGVDVFERSNATAQPMFLIIKGQLVNERVGYYKLDVTRFDEESAVTVLHDVIRNHWYQVKILQVLNAGYATAEEAARNPASNNLFASLELESYPSVSNGNQTLSVDQLDAVFTKLPAVFRTKIYYSNGADKVKAFGLWEQEDYDEYIEDMHLLQKDALLSANECELIVKFKKIPDDTRKFDVSIVARPNEGSSASIITRKVSILLRPPYPFNAALISTGSDVTISFDVPESLPLSLFPFNVYIETKKLTPVAGQGMSYEFANGGYSVKYQVSENDRGKRVSLSFKRNYSNEGETITLSADYYEVGTVNL